MDVIDVPSSPEPSMTRRSASRQPGPSAKRRRPPQPARAPSVVEIIELTDSDSDRAPRRPPKKKRSQPATAKTSADAAPAFGIPDAGMLADDPASAPGSSSQHAAHREQQNGIVPLFLPGSDDERRAVHLPPPPLAQHGLDAAAPAHPPPPEPAAQPALQEAVPADPIDEHLVRVLEIVPDVQPAHALALIEQFMQSQPGNVPEFVLHALFENPSYPKVDKKGKHKRDETDADPDARGSAKPKVDYTGKERAYNCGPHYFACSLEHLTADFPRIPKQHIRSRLLQNLFYAPTYLLLADELKKDPLPFKLKSVKSVVRKGKAKEDPDVGKEREWVLLKVAELAAEQDAPMAIPVDGQECEENGEGIECGCCFSDYPFDQMVQCPEAHLFCKSCMTSYASNLLGEHNPNIVCMDQSGCKLPFPESELARFLSSKLLQLYYRVKQRKEIEAAGLENLEECPFCEYKCVIENEMEKLFRCESAGCGAVTCRICKKPDHLPKTCKEVEDDKHLDAQHVVEEAMTQALMRNCPKCQKSFIKEMGCNKMTCPNCHTVSCYICRNIIHGYDHFSNPPLYSGKADKSKCNLWDPVEQRHAEEVSEAAKRALAELRKTRPDVDEANIKVDIPKAQAAAPPQFGVMVNQAGLGPNGVAGMQAYVGAGVVGPGGLAADVRIGHMPAVMGPGGRLVGGGLGLGLAQMGAGIGAGGAGAGGPGVGVQGVPGVPGVPGVLGNPFVFGAGQAHRFAPLGVAALHRAIVDPHPLQARGRGAGQAVAPVPAVPLALARGRRARRPAPAPVPVPVQVPVQVQVQMQALARPVAAAGGGGRRRKGR